MGPEAPLIDIPEEELVDFEIAVRTVPQFDTEHPKMISQGPSVCIFNKADPQEVLASWLFAQYLLTNEVQIAYACTEGYVPVTLKAQQSEQYQDYLSGPARTAINTIPSSFRRRSFCWTTPQIPSSRRYSTVQRLCETPPGS